MGGFFLAHLWQKVILLAGQMDRRKNRWTNNGFKGVRFAPNLPIISHLTADICHFQLENKGPQQVLQNFESTN